MSSQKRVMSKTVQRNGIKYRVIKKNDTPSCTGCAGCCDTPICHSLPNCYFKQENQHLIFIAVKPRERKLK